MLFGSASLAGNVQLAFAATMAGCKNGQHLPLKVGADPVVLFLGSDGVAEAADKFFYEEVD